MISEAPTSKTMCFCFQNNLQDAVKKHCREGMAKWPRGCLLLLQAAVKQSKACIIVWLKENKQKALSYPAFSVTRASRAAAGPPRFERTLVCHAVQENDTKLWRPLKWKQLSKGFTSVCSKSLFLKIQDLWTAEMLRLEMMSHRKYWMCCYEGAFAGPPPSRRYVVTWVFRTYLIRPRVVALNP